MRRFWLLIWLLGWPLASAQESIDPRIGYCYPAGGKQGTSVRVLAGGQQLMGVKQVFVSGEGVRGTVVRYLGRMLKLNGEERREVVRRLKAMKEGTTGKVESSVELPNHPLLNDLEKLSPLEIDFLVNEFLKPDDKKQPNAQIRETVLLEITIEAGAPVGDREIRLRGNLGLTNPLVFQIGSLPEAAEAEPYDEGASATPAGVAPVTLNGQIRPGDVDRFRFRAGKGNQLVIQTQARRLIPFIADAVPGWFQVVVALFDGEGREIAYADDYRFDPDPVLLFSVPETGEFELEIHDSLFRGREDFVYRVHVAERPFVKSAFPLGGAEGVETVASLDGWNLRERQRTLDTSPGGGSVRHADGATYAVDTLPERTETEPNSTSAEAQVVDLPLIVNGRVASPGDADHFRFDGRSGDEIVIEVLARRLGSPLDALVQMFDSTGGLVAWNDDLERKEGDLRTDMGVMTHHADSYFRAKLPKDGAYTVRLADAQGQGGESCAYRLRIGPPRPDFSICMTPSTLNSRPGVAIPIDVHVLRSDGFDGEIALSIRDAPAGFSLQGARVPAGVNHIRMTLTPPRQPIQEPAPVRLTGAAKVDGRKVEHAVAPCEDSMQAFLWRHLVPVREALAVTVKGAGRAQSPEVTGTLPVQIPIGGTVEVFVRTDPRGEAEDIAYELSGAPKGITLVQTTPGGGGVKLLLKAEGAEPGAAGNLIVEVSASLGGKRKEAQKRRVSVGVLPAIPYRVVP
ncbi:MAG: hypothetical protein HYY93_08895 [Planctomycetes bacterium]|nr:hypothetical protein [Planctomycetota bacterium]